MQTRAPMQRRVADSARRGSSQGAASQGRDRTTSLQLQLAATQPAMASDEGIAALQEQIGNRAMTALLTLKAPAPTRAPLAPRADPARIVQRKELGASDILTALETIPFIKARLAEKLNLGRGDARDAKQQSIRTTVEEVLRQYEGNLKGLDVRKNHAMMLAAVLEAVARAIAVNQLNDPALTPQLSIKLLELYRPEITGSLNEMDQAEQALGLAKAIVSDDPLALYLHGELHLDLAAERIRRMARQANMEPAEMFATLRQKVEMQLAPLTKAGVADTEDKSKNFSVRESTGEMSSRYFATLFAADKPAWKAVPTGGRQLDFTKETERRIVDLQALVKAPATGQAAIPWAPELTRKQAMHLHSVEQRDRAEDRAGKDAAVDAKLASMLNINGAAATKVRQQVAAGLAGLPITITVKGMGWFGGRAPRRKYGEAEYKAGSGRRQKSAYADLFDKPGAEGDISHLGEFDDKTGQDRGANYLRFRNWKDRVMTGGRDMSDSELPTFGAVNVNWKAFSSQSHLMQEANYGVNAYGDTHFILKKQAVQHRLVYTATDHGYPRRDIYLAFADFVLGGEGITKLKDVAWEGIVLHLVNSILTGKPVKSSNQPFEVQVFGPVNIDKDVDRIVVAPSIDAKAKKNIAKFGKKTGIPIEFLGAPDEVVVNETWFKPQPGDKGDNLREQVKARYE